MQSVTQIFKFCFFLFTGGSDHEVSGLLLFCFFFPHRPSSVWTWTKTFRKIKHGSCFVTLTFTSSGWVLMLVFGYGCYLNSWYQEALKGPSFPFQLMLCPAGMFFPLLMNVIICNPPKNSTSHHLSLPSNGGHKPRCLLPPFGSCFFLSTAVEMQQMRLKRC